jgi:hypothetical protein
MPVRMAQTDVNGPSLTTRALPLWLFAFAACGVLAISLVWGYGAFKKDVPLEPSVPPICYWPEHAYIPRDERIPLHGAPVRGKPSIDQRRDLMYRAALDQAGHFCITTSCTRLDWEKYRSALFWYLKIRLQHTRALDMIYGDAGLRRAHDIYTTPEDARVVQGLRDRYRAKVFQLKDLTEHKDATAILVLKGTEALRPCRKSDVAPEATR